MRPLALEDSDRGLTKAVAWLGIAGGSTVIGGYLSTTFLLWMYWGAYYGPPNWGFWACFGVPSFALGGIGIALGLRARSGRLHPAGLGTTGVFSMPAGFFFFAGIPTILGGVVLLVAAVLA